MGEIKTIWQGKPPRKNTDVDINTLSISDDPYTGRKYKETKYDSLFNKLKIGQSIKCQSEDTDKVAQAMRKWLQTHKKKGKVSGVKFYTKTTGRVFWLPVSEK